MLAARMLWDRAPSAVKTGVGLIKGFRVAFDKVSADGSGKCNIRKTADLNDLVHGVVFRIDTDDKLSLDTAEGLGDGYEQTIIKVVVEDGTVDAVAYIARKTDEALKPYDWYHDTVVQGATDHSLPATYIESLLVFEYQPDPDEKRAAENRAFLSPKPIVPVSTMSAVQLPNVDAANSDPTEPSK